MQFEQPRTGGPADWNKPSRGLCSSRMRSLLEQLSCWGNRRAGSGGKAARSSVACYSQSSWQACAAAAAREAHRSKTQHSHLLWCEALAATQAQAQQRKRARFTRESALSEFEHATGVGDRR